MVVESLSKYHRSTGLRFGYILVSPETERGIGGRFEKELKAYVGSPKNLYDLVIPALEKAKAPSPDGIFHHTQMVPRPVQWKGVFRMILGDDDGIQFTKELQKRWDLVFDVLGIQNPQRVATALGLDSGFVPYYCLIDGKDILRTPSDIKSDMHPWNLFETFAKKGVVILPAAKFFGDPVKHQWAVRVSVANQTMKKLEIAMDRIRQTLLEIA